MENSEKANSDLENFLTRPQTKAEVFLDELIQVRWDNRGIHEASTR